MHLELVFSALNGDIVVQKGYFELSGSANILVYFPIISYQRINIYRVETIYIGVIPLNH